MSSRLLAALALGLAGCVAAGDVGASEQTIVNGTVETGRPAVVYMYRFDGAACTGAIIAPQVVLTADHCVEGASARSIRVYVGSSRGSFTSEHRVSEVRQIPGGGGIGIGQPNDVALLVLSAPAGEEPMEIARDAPTRLRGTTVTAVGFGQTPSGGSGTKLTTTTTVEDVGGGFIFVEPAVCSGDSGGPLIGEDGLIYGVASFIYSPDGMTEPRCGSAPGAYNEIHRHLEFIDEVLRDTGVCVPRGDEVCNGEDDDCDGTVDEGCTPLGEACESGSECVGGFCDETIAGRVCTSECDPMRPELGCGPGFYCAADGCEGRCVPGNPGELPHGAECTSNTECASLFCVDPGDGERRCLEPCRSDAGLCLAGEVCTAPSGGCGACVPSAIFGGSRGLGEPCEGDGQCRGDMVCRESGDIRECASSCSEASACAAGFECREGLCIRDRRQGVGGVCLDHADCPAAVCAAQGERRWCTVQCGGPEDCPSGFDCVPGGGTMVCAPMLALEGEACASDAECASGLCLVSGEEGVCTSLCSGEDACAAGLECRRTEDGMRSVCLAPARPAESGGGGCSASHPGGGAAWLAGLLLALGLALARRR